MGSQPTLDTLGLLILGWVVFGVVLGVLWFLLPFAVLGVKGRLDRLMSEVRGLRSDLEATLEPRRLERRTVGA